MSRLFSLLALLAVTVLSGCPDSGGSGGPVDTCQKVGQQCRMGGGQLGVCSMDADGEFECVSQH